MRFELASQSCNVQLLLDENSTLRQFVNAGTKLLKEQDRMMGNAHSWYREANARYQASQKQPTKDKA